MEIIVGVGGLLFAIFMGMYGQRILNEIRGLRISFTKFQLDTEKRLSTVEVKVDKLERDS